jgi:hypothetical protein
LVKYPLTVFILTLVGYTQLFAHLYRGTTFNSSLKTIRGTGHDQAVVIKAAELDDIYVEEEDKEEEERFSLKDYGKEGSYTALFFTHPPVHFQHRVQVHTSQCNYFSTGSFPRAPYILFQVFRL